MRELFANFSSTTRRRALAIVCVLVLSFAVRALTAQFIGAQLTNPGWFPYGIYAVFDEQARNILEGRASAFWIDDPSRTQAAIYPPGYPLWLAFIYALGGVQSAAAVQSVQCVLDALSVLLIVGIGVAAYGWRVGSAAGILAALSPLLALYGVTPLADAPTSWVVLCGVWMLLLAAKRRSIAWALCAGLLVGASCWLRANALLLAAWWSLGLLLFTLTGWRNKMRLSAAIILGAALAIVPVVVRNIIAFHAFVPVGLGTGTNLWEGIGETTRGAEFGAVFGDENLIERERTEMCLPTDAPLGLYWPDGVRRDRARARKALSVITAHPLWYAGVVARRMIGVLKFAGEPVAPYGSAGINVTSAKCLPQRWRGGALAFTVNALGMIQSVLRYILLPLMLYGVWLALRRDARITALILTTVLYYLLVGSLMHTEIRYGLPMQAVLFIFAGFAAHRLSETVSAWVRRRRADPLSGSSSSL